MRYVGGAADIDARIVVGNEQRGVHLSLIALAMGVIGAVGNADRTLVCKTMDVISGRRDGEHTAGLVTTINHHHARHRKYFSAMAVLKRDFVSF